MAVARRPRQCGRRDPPRVARTGRRSRHHRPRLRRLVRSRPARIGRRHRGAGGGGRGGGDRRRRGRGGSRPPHRRGDHALQVGGCRGRRRGGRGTGAAAEGGLTTPLEPVRPIALSEIRDARARIAGTVVRTPLVRLELGPGFPDVRLKLENLQPINAYKLRGAANAVALLSDAERRRGVWTISAGNAGQGVAYAARAAGVPCTVVAIETAPAAKLERMRALGAKLVLVPYGVAWQALDDRSYPGVVGTFIHPFDDQNFITGHATMGLEILEDAPDTVAIIAAIGGGGLITGVASAVKALRSGVKVWGAEPETASTAALSFAKGSAQA